MELKSMFSSKVFSMLIIGALAVVIPGLIAKYIPAPFNSGMMLGVAMIVGAVLIKGKIPYVSQALLVGAGITILGPFLQGIIPGEPPIPESTGSNVIIA